MTLAPEESVFAERGVSYLYADLRDLPLRSAFYDTVVSILTLEHVGKETTRYGVTATPSRILGPVSWPPSES